MNWTLITGGAKGLGASIALALAKQGHHLVLHYRSSKEEVEITKESCQKKGVLVETLQGDFATQEGVDDFITQYLARFQTTYGLVHNVGNYLIKPASHTTLPEWHDLFQTNFFAPIALINALSDQLKQNQGRIISIGTAKLTSSYGYTKSVAYSISKVSLYQTMLSYAKEFASHHVTVNMVSPGFLETAIDLGDSFLPMGRPAHVDEVARVVAFLFSRESGYITGQNIEISGAFNL